MARYARGFDCNAAMRALAKADPALKPWLKRVGRIDPAAGWRKPLDVVDALARAIMYQQLSGKAAATIVGRVEQAIASPLIHHRALSKTADAELRACGVSGNKLLALRDLSRRAAAGEIPTARQLQYMGNEDIIAALLPTRGIGRWTVEMLLMFRLGRPDVLPVDDLGIRKGAQVVDRDDSMPAPKALLVRGELWAPHRTMASLYLWRIADFGKPGEG